MPARGRSDDLALASPASLLPVPVLMPSRAGHVACGTAPPRLLEDVIEAFLPQVNTCYRWSRDNVKESGFLSYVSAGGGVTPEPIAYGTRYEITWHWQHPEATVAASFHTHPNRKSIPVPSGLDLLGATVRGDHLHYILTMDGRLVGWRFSEPGKHPKAVDEALRCLNDARKLGRPFLHFLERAFEGMVPQVVTPVYGAQVTLLADGGIHLQRVAPETLLPAPWGKEK
ncbi:MAG TPA: hypothetical protein VNZ52_11155 [Candidatus Thermoplasmatota archaeon]|nr:hypothetical protein [Candidatus Thermoplasmatota archaeon]